ncbi:hypothetical protein Tco_1073741, partial [Tanacetum coccineum]
MLSDVLFLKGDPLKIDQSALIGKSLPVTWEYMKCSLAGSTCKQGEVEVAVIVARVTLYGKVAHQKFVIATVVTLFRKVAHQTGEFEVVAIATVHELRGLPRHHGRERGFHAFKNLHPGHRQKEIEVAIEKGIRFLENKQIVRDICEVFVDLELAI